jgi:hypothetical protein
MMVGMEENDQFAHNRYGDYSGATFYGPPDRGFWVDHLEVSNFYLYPLFHGMLDKASREGNSPPQLAVEWNCLTGWRELGRHQLEAGQAMEFADALERLVAGDVEPHCVGCTVDECLRCGALIRKFIVERLEKQVAVFIEDD